MPINPVNLPEADGGIVAVVKINSEELDALKNSQPTNAAVNSPSSTSITTTVNSSTAYFAKFGFMLQSFDLTADAIMSDFHFNFSFSPNVSGDDETGIGVTLFQSKNWAGGQVIQGTISYSQPFVSSFASQALTITLRAVYGIDPSEYSFTIWRNS